ncbi:hypothetical protein [Roseicella aerolata]|uniref:Uncharacterized protein n=1 Tax=Roseicella aerolata TaxID=2883479 RepID=A0A9X1IGL7_9PROT|nr:hypothetical protein [Roseicella aerolata]MCB4823784.1 hypothetical protein [Roseicella aerolata]
MGRVGGTAARTAVLGIAVLLGGCTAFNNGTANVADSMTRAGDRIGAPWGQMRATTPEQSITAARITGTPVEVTAVTPEAGDVWPVPEAPRATLANPDAAMRGIPNYRPGELDRPSGPAPRSQWQPTDPAPLPPGLRGSSSPPPQSNRGIDVPQPQAVAPPLPDQNAPPPRRADGRVITTPSGPAITTGGNDRVQSYITPGGGTGTAVIDGNTTTLIGPGGQVQTVPTRR